MNEFVCPKCLYIPIENLSRSETCKTCDSHIAWLDDDSVLKQLVDTVISLRKDIESDGVKIRGLEHELRRTNDEYNLTGKNKSLLKGLERI